MRFLDLNSILKPIYRMSRTPCEGGSTGLFYLTIELLRKTLRTFYAHEARRLVRSRLNLTI